MENAEKALSHSLHGGFLLSKKVLANNTIERKKTYVNLRTEKNSHVEKQELLHSI